MLIHVVVVFFIFLSFPEIGQRVSETLAVVVDYSCASMGHSCKNADLVKFRLWPREHRA